MVTAVLTDFADVDLARKELNQKGLSFIDPPWRRLVRRIVNDQAGGLGDYLKSWDVNLAYKFISERVNPNSCILDLGCYKSEIIPILNASGYLNLYGIDLNEKTKFSIKSGEFIFKKGNFYEMPMNDSSVDCISAISVIEHGYNGALLFSEISRVLKPGGYFIASYDYWPEKVDVGEKRYFGLPWIIFDDAEVSKMNDFASNCSMNFLAPECEYTINEPVINFDGFRYTFAVSIYQKI